ncbi:MAG: RING finger domain-containing protein, partial [Flavobacteriales bacterium]|nr:RING finger domain-containing protein [Flavobacteriales bacterium]
FGNGTVYEGAFEDGKPHGKGRMTYANGAIYEGAFEDGKPHGEGKMTYKDGTVYEGEWKDAKPTRQGKVTFSQGALDKIGKFFYDQENTIQGCAICTNTLEGDLSVLTPCNHIFHEKCIKQWEQQQNSCPSCRIEIKHRLPISSDLLIKQIEEYKIQNPQNPQDQNEGADQNDIIIEEENNLQQGQPELLITQLDKLMQRLDGQHDNSYVNNMEDITHLELALKNFDTTKINSLIQQLNEALNKEAELKIIDNPDKQDYENKLTLLKEAVENFKNSKQ